MATPTLIAVKSDRKQQHGDLGIMYNLKVRSTELEVIYPRVARRQSKTNTIFAPPSYLGRDGTRHYMVWCPCCANKLASGQIDHANGTPILDAWKRREAFYPNATRGTGCRGYAGIAIMRSGRSGDGRGGRRETILRNMRKRI